MEITSDLLFEKAARKMEQYESRMSSLDQKVAQVDVLKAISKTSPVCS